MNEIIYRLKNLIRIELPGRCRKLSEGDDCMCGLCECERLQQFIDEKIPKKKPEPGKRYDNGVNEYFCCGFDSYGDPVFEDVKGYLVHGSISDFNEPNWKSCDEVVDA